MLREINIGQTNWLIKNVMGKLKIAYFAYL